MGRQSIKENKLIYQIYREKAGLTREKASDLMDAISPSRIEKIENGQEPTPYDIIQMAACYRKPDLCNYFCSHRCEIGKRFVPEVSAATLPNIILETIASLNDISPFTNMLIQIARDGMVTDDEIPDFAKISVKLDKISAAINALNLWIEKTSVDNNINIEMLKKEKGLFNQD